MREENEKTSIIPQAMTEGEIKEIRREMRKDVGDEALHNSAVVKYTEEGCVVLVSEVELDFGTRIIALAQKSGETVGRITGYKYTALDFFRKQREIYVHLDCEEATLADAALLLQEQALPEYLVWYAEERFPISDEDYKQAEERYAWLAGNAAKVASHAVYFEDVYVLPEHRGTGVLSLMFRALEMRIGTYSSAFMVSPYLNCSQDGTFHFTDEMPEQEYIAEETRNVAIAEHEGWTVDREFANDATAAGKLFAYRLASDWKTFIGDNEKTRRLYRNTL